MSSFIPREIQEIIREIRDQSDPSFSVLSEEEQSISPSFMEDIMLIPVERHDFLAPIEVGPCATKIVYEAFLDGVQRTVMWCRIRLPTGALVPIHIAHIAAGAVLRDRSGRLFIDPDLIAARLLLLGPFRGLEEAGIKSLPFSDITWDTDTKTFGFPATPNEWIVCDTTFCGTDKKREERRKGALLGNELFKEGLIRSRAQGRVATLRQRLEFAVLARFRAKYPEKWVLFDGPLFFIDKWRRRATKVLGAELGEQRESPFEAALLAKTVGLIKTHRLRPKRPDQVLKIGPNERSSVVRTSKEVDMKGSRGTPDEEGSYAGAHLTWYTRLRGRNTPPYGLLGLVRIDVHRATFGIESADELSPENFDEYRPLVDAITQGIWMERWPAFRRVEDYRSATQVYPIEQLEKVLKARVYPRRFLASIWAAEVP